MKLCRFGPPGKERPGLLDTNGRIRDLSAHVTDIDVAVLAPAALAELSKLDVAGLPVVEEGVRYGVPVAQVRKFIAIGLNYRDHAEEAGMTIPTEPIIFHKAISCLTGPDDDIVQPPHSTKLDWELELG